MSMLRADLRKTGLMGGDLGFAAAVCSQGNFSRATGTGNVSNPPVGDSWSVQITSAPASSPVVLQKNTQQGVSQSITGYTDQYGTFNQGGTFGHQDVGPQTWSWIIGGRNQGSWPFTVRPPSDTPANRVPPAALLTPMPSIIPVKPGQVSSDQAGLKCRIDSWVNGNPLMAVAVALGIGYLLRGKR